MKKVKLLAIAVVLLSMPASFIFAATLDELNNPLLNKGQWRLDSEANLNYYDLESRYDPLTSAAYYSKYDYGFWQLSPAVYYGITDQLQFTLSNSFDIPYSYDYTQYLQGQGADTRYKFKEKYNYFFSEELKWRPDQSWEFYFNPFQAEYRQKNFAYDYTSGLTDETNTHNNAYYFLLGATWLSQPQPGNKTTNNRPDLDGLIDPLLNSGQFRVDFPLLYSYSDLKSRSDNEVVSPAVNSWDTIGLKQVSLYFDPELMYGIKDNLQMSTGLTVYAPSIDKAKTVFYVYEDDGTDIIELSLNEKTRVLEDWSPYLRLTQRPHPQFEWYVQATYTDYKARQNIHATLYENGVLDTSTSAEGKLCLKSLAELIGFTWISQPSRQGEALAADLNGLKRPLLEKGQLRLDFSFTANQDRQRISAQSSTPQEYYEFYTRFMYGLADALQVYLLAQVQPKYAYLTDYGTSATHYLYPISPQYGLGLTYRPKNNFEVYLDVTLSPSLDSKVSSYDAGGPTSINYSEQESTFVTLGATVLW